VGKEVALISGSQFLLGKKMGLENDGNLGDVVEGGRYVKVDIGDRFMPFS